MRQSHKIGLVVGLLALFGFATMDAQAQTRSYVLAGFGAKSWQLKNGVKVMQTNVYDTSTGRRIGTERIIAGKNHTTHIRRFDSWLDGERLKATASSSGVKHSIAGSRAGQWGVLRPVTLKPGQKAGFVATPGANVKTWTLKNGVRVAHADLFDTSTGKRIGWERTVFGKQRTTVVRKFASGLDGEMLKTTITPQGMTQAVRYNGQRGWHQLHPIPTN